MRITIFGASGGIGQMLTEQALEHGHIVTSYVRRPESFKKKHPNLTIVVGELTNQTQIEMAIRNSDVIISTLGPALDTSRKLKGTPIADGHEKIISAMKKLNKERLITLATPTVSAKEDRKSIITLVPNIMAKLLLPNAYQEMKKLEHLIKESALKWTVVRMINPNIKYTGQKVAYSLGDVPGKMKVSRENVAHFMYQVSIEGSFIQKMPIVFNE